MLECLDTISWLTIEGLLRGTFHVLELTDGLKNLFSLLSRTLHQHTRKELLVYGVSRYLIMDCSCFAVCRFKARFLVVPPGESFSINRIKHFTLTQFNSFLHYFIHVFSITIRHPTFGRTPL
jgi:hypothetical protein